MSEYRTKFMSRVDSLMHVYRASDNVEIDHKINNIKYNGCLKKSDKFCCVAGDGDYYVYVWMHLGGELFYVGSGKGDRWLNRHRRIEFMRHLDQGDAVVYKVLSGVDKQTSLMYEKYISFCFSWIRDSIVNRDNNLWNISPSQTTKLLRLSSELENTYLTRLVEETVVKILENNSFQCAKAVDILAIGKFRRIYGETYFSDGEVGYWRD